MGKSNSLRTGYPGCYVTWCLSSMLSKLSQAQRDIASLYSHRGHVLPQDRDLFCASLEAHLLQPLSQLNSWLVLNKPLILMSVRQAKDASSALTPRLHSFYRKLPPSRSHIIHRGRHRSPRTYRTQRMTQFATRITRPSFHVTHPRKCSTNSNPPPIPPARPRQRYLFDFFPNHPG